jgi:small subunit ribosomal protein S1
LENFGAFVDIGCGIVALLSVDCISISRFSHPKDRICNGMFIYTVLKAVDEEHKRFFVSMRELLGTWEQNAGEFSPGETVPGIVRSIENYGIFVELTPNLAGLAEYSEGITAGCHAGVYIKSMLPERMKIKLIIVDAFEAEYPTPPIKYYTESDHIDHWIYSPVQCSKVIESTF